MLPDARRRCCWALGVASLKMWRHQTPNPAGTVTSLAVTNRSRTGQISMPWECICDTNHIGPFEARAAADFLINGIYTIFREASSARQGNSLTEQIIAQSNSKAEHYATYGVALCNIVSCQAASSGYFARCASSMTKSPRSGSARRK